MDEINALITGLVQTKSIEHALAPTVSQVSNLILQNEAFENGNENAFPQDLVESASKVAGSSKQLIVAGNSLVACSTDQELASQMPRACDSLAVAGETLVTAAHRLYSDGLSPQSRRHLIRTAKDVLEATLKVLLVSDDAEVRRLVQSSQVVIQHLQVLTVIKNMADLVSPFKQFTGVVMQFTKLVETRQHELLDRKQRESVMAAHQMLKRTLPMLSSALQTYAKYPNSAQAKSSKELATGQVLECVHDIIETLRHKQSVTSHDDADEPGHFVLTIDQILDALSVSRRLKSVPLGSNLDHHLGVMARHCMAVAHFSADSPRKHLISSCQSILAQRNQLAECLSGLNANPDMEALRQEFDESSQHLICQIKRLEEDVSKAVIHMVVDVFKESTEPLERLVRAALTQPQMSDECMEDYRESFHSHSDSVCQAARFVAAGCPHADKVREIGGCAAQLERLDPEMLPAIAACSHGSQHAAGTAGTPGATQHLKLLKREWGINVDLLIASIDDVIDHGLFIEIAESKLRDHMRKCRQSAALDLSAITRESRAVVGSGRRLAAVAKLAADARPDVMERHNIHQAVTAFKKNIQSFKSGASHVLGNHTHHDEHERLHQQCDSLGASQSRLMAALSRDHDSIHDVLSDNGDLSDSFTEKNSIVSECSEKQNEEIGFAPRKFSELSQAPLSSQVSLHGLTLNGHTWNGKENSAFSPVSSLNNSANSGHSHAVTSDPTYEHIEELSRTFASTAIAGNKSKLELLSNDLLKWTNHAADAVKNIAPVLSAEGLNSGLESGSSGLSSAVTECIELGGRLLACDTSCLQQLHTATHTWSTTVSHVLREIDKCVGTWKVHSDKVVHSAKTSNAKLLNAHFILLHKHVTSASEIGQSALVLSSGLDDVDSCRYANSIQEHSQCLNQLTTQLQTLSSTDSSDLDRLSRKWAETIFILLRSTELLSQKRIALHRGQGHLSHNKDAMKLRHELNVYSQDSIRIKALVEEMEESLGDASLKEALEQLEKALLCMEDCYDIIATAVPQSKQHEKMYAPYTLLLLQWSWCNKVQDILVGIDRITGRTYGVDALTANGKELKSHMVRIKTKTFAAIKPCHATDQKQTILATLDSMDALATQLSNMQLKRITTSDDNIRVTCMTRKWAILCHLLTTQIDKLHTTNPVACKEVKKLLQGPQMKESAVMSPYEFESKQQQVALNIPSVSASSATSHHGDASAPAHRRPLEIKDKGMRHSYVPSTTSPKSTPDTSWKELKKGPQVQHGTPERSLTSTPVIQLRKTPAAQVRLPVEMERWEDDGNPVVQVARQIARHVADMDAYLKGQGPLKDHDDIVGTAKTVASKSEKLVKFARILADHSIDKRCADNLSHACDRAPMLIAQLQILAGVGGASSADDQTSERMLVNTARNLVDAFSTMLVAAEASSVKGLRKPAPDATDETEAVVLATQWKVKLGQHRSKESAAAPKDELGLRRVTAKAPGLNQLIQTG